MLSRRSFLRTSTYLIGTSLVNDDFFPGNENTVMTVSGPIAASAMGESLIHEHILVDFIGAEKYNPKAWTKEAVINKALPFLQELKQLGCRSFVDCTPNYLGRNAGLLAELSIISGLQIITNTGYYGGSDNKYLPAHAFTESDQELAIRWITEAKNGIDGTTVRPGFIKISVNNSTLTDISKKLVRAAALCHLQTGLIIASHTGPAIPAFEEIQILKDTGVSPSAFVWVHAQNEKDWNLYVEAAKQGTWVSLDGLSDQNVNQYVERLLFLRSKHQLHQVLVSHDAGWFDPGKPGGGDYRGYSTLFLKLIPALKQAQFTEKEIALVTRLNPSNAFTVRVREHRV